MLGHVSKDVLVDHNGAESRLLGGAIVHSAISAAKAGARVLAITKTADEDAASVAFIRSGGADLIVIDAQYTLGEAIEKYSWGHSAFSLAADFASNWGIRKLVLFHHDPTYDDKKLYGILQSARWYIDHMSIKGVEAMLATEGTEIRI